MDEDDDMVLRERRDERVRSCESRDGNQRQRERDEVEEMYARVKVMAVEGEPRVRQCGRNGMSVSSRGIVNKDFRREIGGAKEREKVSK